jgi:hypothetical protein
MMKKVLVLLAVGLATGWMPLTVAQASETIVKTPDGLEFKFGVAQKNVFFHLSGLDLTSRVPTCKNGDCNFRDVTVPDVFLGTNQFGVFNFSNLIFDLGKGPVNVHFNLEVEATLDENVVDVNHLNLERAAASYKTGLIGELFFGFDVHLFDPEGGLIYQDEDPGVWLVGREGGIAWNLAYHKRLTRARGVPLGRLGTGFPGANTTSLARTTNVDSNIFEARVDFDVPVAGAKLTIAPLLLANIRNSAQAGDMFACPSGTCTTPAGFTAGPFFGIAADNRTGGNSTADIVYPGVVVNSTVGPLILTFEGAGMLGTIGGLGPNYRTIYNDTSLDVRAYAFFAELALDLAKVAPSMSGLTPFFNLDFRSGDDSPFGSTRKGYVAISDLTSALRKDGFNKQSISSFGPQPLGAGGEAAWGFNTGGRGIGPTLGSILEDTALSPVTFYNSRWGKSDNPGMLKLSGGLLGKLNSQWDAKAAVSYLRFDTIKPIQAEACLNRFTRGLLPGLTSLAACRTAFTSVVNDLSHDMGLEFNANVGWSPLSAIRFQPFISVFVPFNAVDAINGLLLNSANSRNVYMGGLEFRAQF